MRSPLEGAPCDADHPFPAPACPYDWIDSMEYGAEERRPGGEGMMDMDPSPTWRLIAAEMWRADCRDQHAGEVAADPYLTTHLLAVAVIVGLPRRPMLYAAALEGVGAGDPLNAMQAEGLAAAREKVEEMPLDRRRAMVLEAMSLVVNGWVTLQLDIHDAVVKGVGIGRG